MHDTSPCKVLYVYTRTSAAKYQSPASLQARRQLQPNLPLPCFSRTQHAEAAAAAFPRTVSPSRACYRTDAASQAPRVSARAALLDAPSLTPSAGPKRHEQASSLRFLFPSRIAVSFFLPTGTLAAPGPMRPRLLLFLFRPRSLCSPSDQEAAPVVRRPQLANPDEAKRWQA
jgi:hypothetical protein